MSDTIKKMINLLKETDLSRGIIDLNKGLMDLKPN